MNPFSIACKNNEWLYSVVRISSPLIVSFHWIFDFSYFISLLMKSTIRGNIVGIYYKEVGLFLCFFLEVAYFNYIWQLMPLSSVGEKFDFHLISTYLLELLGTEYLRKFNINFYLPLTFICTLAALKQSSEKQEIRKEMVEMLKYDSVRKRRAGT